MEGGANCQLVHRAPQAHHAGLPFLGNVQVDQRKNIVMIDNGTGKVSWVEARSTLNPDFSSPTQNFQPDLQELGVDGNS